MLSVPSDVLAVINGTADSWHAGLVTITLLDGTAIRWATSEIDIDYGDLYAAGPVQSLTKHAEALPQIDTLDLGLVGRYPLAGSTLARKALLGYFDGARINVDRLVGEYPGDISKSPVLSWFEGRIAGLDPQAATVRLRAKAEAEALNVQIPRYLWRPMCGHQVYDPACGLDRTDFTYGGTVASGAITASSFLSSLTSQADDYFDLGVLSFYTGALTGVRRAVRYYAHGTGAFTLALPLPAIPTVGDGFHVYPGCSKLFTTCNVVFGNTARFRGFRHIPIEAR